MGKGKMEMGAESVKNPIKEGGGTIYIFRDII